MPVHNEQFDVIVVGGGHAGVEAAYAAARLGSKTLLITLDLDKIGLMPCNPAIGGIGKGHIVFEISALGGLMPKLCTQTYLQARMLNTRKGPAVQGLRLQIDKHAYRKLSRSVLERTNNLTMVADMVEEIIVDKGNNRTTGVLTSKGVSFNAPSVVLTTGTFLNGLTHIGTKQAREGRQGEQSVHGLAQFLKDAGLAVGRLKTGTPPRLLRSSIDFTKLEAQAADPLDFLFEFESFKATSSHVCYIAHTNEKTHNIIRKNLHLSAMYNGNISGIGPRYCPSIEDKIGRFPDKISHHVFVEPESATCDEIYPNGISTSLPIAVQEEYVRSIVGFENAVIVRPGYAVEYDFVMPNQLEHTLELKAIRGIFLAGQINGTTGYEEAAGQGIMAGINAHLTSRGLAGFILDRSESYIGLMIDDLVTMGVDEPYRMFTSRAERRLLLRQDNAFLRIMPKAHQLGLVDDELFAKCMQEKKEVSEAIEALHKLKKGAEIVSVFAINPKLAREQIAELTGIRLHERAAQTVCAHILYEPYLIREIQQITKREQQKNLALPADFLYDDLPGLSKELQQKLTHYKPQTIADAALISGMTPSALALLIFYRSKELVKKKNIIFNKSHTTAS